MKKLVLILVVLTAILAAIPSYYYISPKPGGQCTIKTILYFSVAPDTFVNRPDLQRIELSNTPGECQKWVVIGSGF